MNVRAAEKVKLCTAFHQALSTCLKQGHYTWRVDKHLIYKHSLLSCLGNELFTIPIFRGVPVIFKSDCVVVAGKPVRYESYNVSAGEIRTLSLHNNFIHVGIIKY